MRIRVKAVEQKRRRGGRGAGTGCASKSAMTAYRTNPLTAYGEQPPLGAGFGASGPNTPGPGAPPVPPSDPELPEEPAPPPSPIDPDPYPQYEDEPPPRPIDSPHGKIRCASIPWV